MSDKDETLDLGQIMKQAIEQFACGLNITMPGKIVSYNPTKNLAVVQPAFKRKYKDDPVAVNLPTISNVPIGFMKMGGAHVSMEVSAGDEGELHFHQRSIERWLSSGGEVDPLDVRKFALSDCTFWPGLTSNGNALKRNGSTTSTEIAKGETYIELKKSGDILLNAKNQAFIDILKTGKFRIRNGNEEAMQIMSEVIELLSTMTTNTVFGPMRVNEHPQFIILKQRWDTLKG